MNPNFSPRSFRTRQPFEHVNEERDYKLQSNFPFQVVVLCGMLWALPVIWPEYQAYYHPYWSKYLLPLVQIALMSSVYCTIIMSWERYVRICLVCRGDDYFDDGKFKAYMAFIMFFPVIFYIPKFFEVRDGHSRRLSKTPLM